MRVLTRGTVLGIRNLLAPDLAALLNGHDWPRGPGDLTEIVLQYFRASGKEEDSLHSYT